MINQNIEKLINESENKIEESLIFLGVLGIFLIGWLLTALYRMFAKVTVSPKYLTYYTPIKNNFFEFLKILDEHSDEFTHIRVAFKDNGIVCKHISSSNKELECVLGYIFQIQLFSFQIVLSTLYDDKYDLLNIRGINDVFNAKYNTPGLNPLLDNLKGGMVLFQSTVISLNKASVNEFGIPLSASYKDLEKSIERTIRTMVAESTNWS